MDKLRCMEAFVAVIETGNFSAAAEKLDVSSVMVGKHIRQLEELLGAGFSAQHTPAEPDGSRCRLLRERAHGAGACTPGRAFHRNHAGDAARSAARERAGDPWRMRRRAADLGLSPWHTEVKVELVLNNARVDLIEEGFDLAIRIGALADSSWSRGHCRLIG